MTTKYEVQTYMFFGGWENCWSDEDKPWYFDTPEEAQAEIDDYIADCKQAVEDGDMIDAPSPDELRIMPVEV